MKVRHIKQQLNCELPEIEPPAHYTLEYSPAPSKSLAVPLSPGEILSKKVVRLREGGMSYRAIAAELGIPSSTVSRHLSRAGLKTRLCYLTLRNKRIAVEMWKDGASTAEIARAIRRHVATARQYIAEFKTQHGID